MEKNDFIFRNLESRLYESSIELTGHKKYYDNFFQQSSLNLPDGSNVLDAGCGGGLLGIGLLKEYAKKRNIDVTVHAFDNSHSMLYLARENAVRENVEDNLRLYRVDGRDIPFQDFSFDLVMSSGMLEYIHSQEKAIKEITRVLKPRGVLILSFVRDNPLGYLVSKLWNFEVLPEWYLRDKLQREGIKDLGDCTVYSNNFYMKALKGILIGIKRDFSILKEL